MRSTFISLAGWTFLLLCVLTTAIVIVNSIKRYRAARTSLVATALRAVAALIVWGALSVGYLAMLTGYAAGHLVAAEPPFEFGTPELSVVGALLFYVLAGGGLIYWVSRRGRVP